MEYDAQLHNIQCPKCQHGMEEIFHEEVAVDRCTNCFGLWFDDDEAHQLKALEGSEHIDSGDPTEGWKYDSRANINCPHCGKLMDMSFDEKQKHIWYEICVDHGLFMDAGEFTDFKTEDWLDWFRSLIKGHRDVVAP